MDSFFKNIILCGDVNYYCLLCEEAFEFLDQIERHIRWEQHRKKMKSLSYNSKYKNHRIYKIGDYFYCEICNYATKTLINDHINDNEHMFKKSNPSTSKRIPSRCKNVTRQNTGLVNYKGRIMDNLQWHGIVNNHCTLCKVSIQNVKHIEGVDHMAALVQDKMAIRIQNMQLECKLQPKDLKQGPHSNKQIEKEIKENCIANKETPEDAVENKILTPADENNEAVKSLLKKEQKYFYINLKAGKARCLHCKELIFDLKLSSLTAHRRAHGTEDYESDSSDDTAEYFQIRDHGNHRSLIKKYGRENFIKLSRGGRHTYCFLCDVHISPNLTMVEQHVRGAIHQGMLYARHIKEGLRKTSRTFSPPVLKSIVGYIEGLKHFKELDVVCLHMGICLSSNSLAFLMEINDIQLKCFICDKIDYYNVMIVHHGNSDAHIKNFGSAPLAYIQDDPSLADEFIREMKPNLYHCGYCNKVFPFWDQIRLHLKSKRHKFAKKKKAVIYSTLQVLYMETDLEERNRKIALLREIDSFPFF